MINKIKLQNKVMQRFISNAKNECKDCNKLLEHCICIEDTINFKHQGKQLTKEEVMDSRSSAYQFINFDKVETSSSLIERMKSFQKQWQLDMEAFLSSKQETLEEVKQNYLNKCVKEVRYTGYCDEDFEQGAKFQQEQDKSKYSEEEVLELLNNYHRAAFAYTKASSASPKEWFENFKKK